MTAGRPAKFTNDNKLQEAIQDYFDNELNRPTITKLALSLGFSTRQSFYDNMKNKHFSELFKDARIKINPTNNKRKFDYKKAYQPNERLKERLKLDSEFRFKFNLSSLIRFRLKTKNKEKTIDILPYSIVELKAHIESKFTDGMTWDNYGKWHIDHIIPQSTFKFTTSKCPDFIKCWDLNNLQPLWAIDNLRKSNRVVSLPIKKSHGQTVEIHA